MNISSDIQQMKLRHRLTYYFPHFLSRWLQRKSFSFRDKFAKNIGAFLYNYIPIRKARAKQNIKIAFPNENNDFHKKTLRDLYYTSSRNLIDFIAFPASHKNTEFEIIGKEILDKEVKKRNGVILVTAHFGLWELWASWLGQNNYDIWGIIQRQKNQGADLFFKEKRESYGMNHIYRKSSLDAPYEALKNGSILILASDQNAKKKGVNVKFFNKNSSTPKGAAIFHLRAKASIIFSVAEIIDINKIRISFKKVRSNSKSTVETITQNYTSELEKFVTNNPGHYFWFHNKWKIKN